MNALAHRRLPIYLGFNLATLSCVFLVPFSWELPLVALASYYVRMLAVTAGYHRYFSHRSFTVRNRAVQFALALFALTAVQRGPIWWATAHRWHHQHADAPEDLHSPRHRGFWESHILWIFSMKADPLYKPAPPKDLLRFPEIVFLDRFDFLGPLLYGGLLYAIGGWAWVVWGLGVATIVLWHGCSTINSLGHQYGEQPFDTGDDSRNNPWLVPVTLGEGWHNNHHASPGSAANGFLPGEIDLVYLAIRAAKAVGLVTHINPVPPGVLARRGVRRAEPKTPSA